MIPTHNAKLPTHEVIYRRLRDMVMLGDLTPGQPVTIQGLVETLGSGMTPVREAIRRLIAEGALASTGTRRVLVPELNAQQLSEIDFARNALEPRLAMMAMAHITPEQIGGLEQVDAELDQAIETGDIQAYLRLNHAFHHGIYTLANAPILSSMTDALWLRVGPSLRVVCGRVGTANLPDMHEEAISAMRAGNAAAVGDAIRADIAQGHAQISRALAVG